MVAMMEAFRIDKERVIISIYAEITKLPVTNSTGTDLDQSLRHEWGASSLAFPPQMFDRTVSLVKTTEEEERVRKKGHSLGNPFVSVSRSSCLLSPLTPPSFFSLGVALLIVQQ